MARQDGPRAGPGGHRRVGSTRGAGRLAGVQCAGKDVGLGVAVTERELREEVRRILTVRPALAGGTLFTTAGKDAVVERVASDAARSASTSSGGTTCSHEPARAPWLTRPVALGSSAAKQAKVTTGTPPSSWAGRARVRPRGRPTWASSHRLGREVDPAPDAKSTAVHLARACSCRPPMARPTEPLNEHAGCEAGVDARDARDQGVACSGANRPEGTGSEGPGTDEGSRRIEGGCHGERARAICATSRRVVGRCRPPVAARERGPGRRRGRACGGCRPGPPARRSLRLGWRPVPRAGIAASRTGGSRRGRRVASSSPGPRPFWKVRPRPAAGWLRGTRPGSRAGPRRAPRPPAPSPRRRPPPTRRDPGARASWPGTVRGPPP